MRRARLRRSSVKQVLNRLEKVRRYEIPKYNFSSKYEFLDFVKKHKNVFCDKVTYSSGEVGVGTKTFLYVKEFNYHNGDRTVWLWLTDGEHYWVFEDVGRLSSSDIYDIVKGLSGG